MSLKNRLTKTKKFIKKSKNVYKNKFFNNSFANFGNKEQFDQLYNYSHNNSFSY